MKNSNLSQAPQRYVQILEWIGIPVASVKKLIEFHEGEFILLTETNGNLEEATVTRDGTSFSLRDFKDKYDMKFKVFVEQKSKLTTFEEKKNYQYLCGECLHIWIPSRGTSLCPICDSDELSHV